MEAVRSFNNELSSLYESKPPVSRAKMAQVTKFAIKAIKFYKHVVQSVEKFIQKCKPEYKVPGLYVIDSIVRQSRHQFGPDKDVFCPRFIKNIVATFGNLLKCPVEERSRIVRVLNLWQKNAVFPLEIIQPLLDLAADPDNPELIASAHRAVDSVLSTSQKVSVDSILSSSQKMPEDSILSSSQKVPVLGPQPSSNGGDSNSNPPLPQVESNPTVNLHQTESIPSVNLHQTESNPSVNLHQSDMLSTITKLLQQAQEGAATKVGPESQLQQLQQLQQQLAMQNERVSKPQPPTPAIDGNLLAQIQTLTSQLLSKTSGSGAAPSIGPTPSSGVIPFIGPTPSSGAIPFIGPISSSGAIPSIGPTLSSGVTPSSWTTLSSGPTPSNWTTLSAVEEPKVTNKQNSVEPLFNKKLLDFDYGDSDEEEDRQDHQQQHHHHLQQQVQQIQQPSIPLPALPPPVPEPSILQQIQQISQQQEQLQSEIGAQDQLRRRLLEQQQQQFDMEIEQESLASQPQPAPPQIIIQEETAADSSQVERDNRDSRDSRENQDRSERRRRRDSRDRSRSPRRRSRRSRSRDRDRDRRRRSRSRDRHRRSRSRDRERREREREKERERRKMGLPPLKEKHISICSTTLWIGHLTKYTIEKELREHVEDFGKIRTINMIPPRGCAFVCLTKRKDASKALERLKGVKINGSAIKVAWAPGVGIKESSFKDLWDVDLGVAYIPWEQLPSDCIPLLAGGMVDEESLPEKLKGMKTGEEEEEEEDEVEEIPPPQNTDSGSGGVQQENNITQSQQQPPPPLPMGIPGQPSIFPLPGQNPLNMMGPGGPLSLLSGPPPPIGMPPGIGAPIGLGGPSNLPAPNMIVNHSNIPLPPTGMNVAGLRGPMPNLPGIGPRPMNIGPPGSVIGGPANFIGAPRGGLDPHAGVNSPGPRIPFGQFGNMPRFPPIQNVPGMQPPGMQPPGMQPPGMQPPGMQPPGMQPPGMQPPGMQPPGMQPPGMQPPGMQPPGMQPPGMQPPGMQPPGMQPQGMQPPFVNSDQSGMGDSDMRAMAEPKEWPPDDEVNAEDELDNHPMDSDERILQVSGQQRILGPGMPNMQAIGNPFGIRGPLLPGQRPPNPMLSLPRAPSPNTGMPSLIPIHMMPPGQQQQVLTVPGTTAAGFALAPGGVRLTMSAVGVRQNLMPAVSSPHLIPPPAGAPHPVAVTVNGSVVVSGPGMLPSNIPIPVSQAASPETSEEDKLASRTLTPMPVMQIHGSNHPPSGPVLGRGFAPMTIRPRAGPGLLGVRPGTQGGGGFNRFGGPRPPMGPAFGGMDRPPFGNRFGVPLRPPVGFLDQDERADRDERRPLPMIDDDTGARDGDRSLPKDIDERRDSNEMKDGKQDVDLRQDIDERSKPSRSAGRRSRWGSEDTMKSAPEDGLNSENKPANNESVVGITESIAVTTSPLIEGTAATSVMVGSQSAVTTKTDSSYSNANISVVKTDNGVEKVSSGGGDTIQPSRSNNTGEITNS